MEWMSQAFQRVLDPEDNQTGGGAASAIASAMSAALVGMVARVSIGKKGLEEDDVYRQIDEQAQRLSQELLAGAQADSQAFDAVMAAFRMPRDTEEQKTARSQTIQRAMIGATETPLATAQGSVKVLDLCARLKDRSNPNAASDLDCAYYLAHAGLRGALSNMAINLTSIKDPQEKGRLEKEFQHLQSRVPSSLDF